MQCGFWVSTLALLKINLLAAFMAKLTCASVRLHPGNTNLTKQIDFDYLVSETQVGEENWLVHFGGSLAPFEASFSTATNLMILSGVLNEVMNILTEGLGSEIAKNSFLFGILPA